MMKPSERLHALYDEDIHKLRRRSSSVVVSPSITIERTRLIELLMLCNQQVWLNCPSAHYKLVIEELSRSLGIEAKTLRKRVGLLDGVNNPFDNADAFNRIIESVFFPQETINHLELLASSFLVGTPEAKRIEMKIPDENQWITDVFPPFATSLYMRHIWMPIALRMRYLLPKFPEINSVYSSVDPYEVKLVDNFILFSSDTPPEMRKRIVSGDFLPPIDHKPFFLAEYLSFLSVASHGDYSSDNILKDSNKNKSAIHHLGLQLEIVADGLYSPPYYVLNSDLRRSVDTSLRKILSKIPTDHIRSLILGLVGEIPIPFSLPNPVSLFSLWKDFNEKRKLSEEFGWLIYLINISQARPSFGITDVPLIHNMKKIKFSNDVIYTVRHHYVVNARTHKFHKPDCYYISRTRREEAILLDDPNWPNAGQPCNYCLGAHRSA